MPITEVQIGNILKKRRLRVAKVLKPRKLNGITIQRLNACEFQISTPERYRIDGSLYNAIGSYVMRESDSRATVDPGFLHIDMLGILFNASYYATKMDDMLQILKHVVYLILSAA